VKIKITEYFPGFVPEMTPSDPDPSFPSELLPGAQALFDHGGDGTGDDRESQPFGILTPNPSPPDGHVGIAGERLFTIQRVNGNGANGKNDGVGGGHRHTLEESDRVKKNSVQRRVLSQTRERKRSSPVSISLFIISRRVEFNTAL
jgi:glutathione S-transferase